MMEIDEDILTRKGKWRRVGVVILCVIGSILVLIGAYSVVVVTVATSAIRNSQVTSINRNENIETIAERIRSCTTPEGECSRQAAKSQREAIDAIDQDGQERAATNRQFAVYAAFCADKPGSQSLKELEDCIGDLANVDK